MACGDWDVKGQKQSVELDGWLESILTGSSTGEDVRGSGMEPRNFMCLQLDAELSLPSEEASEMVDTAVCRPSVDVTETITTDWSSGDAGAVGGRTAIEGVCLIVVVDDLERVTSALWGSDAVLVRTAAVDLVLLKPLILGL